MAPTIPGVDFNTIGFLTGMMVIVAITQKSGIFEFVAIWSVKKVNANPTRVLPMLASTLYIHLRYLI